MQKLIILVITGAAMLGCSERIRTPRLNVKSANYEQEIEVSYKPGVAIIDIHCHRGIGRAAVTKADDSWPEKIVFHLHLRGLESFSINNRIQAVNTGIRSTRPYRVICSTDGKSRKRLVESDPMWANVEIVPAKGKKAEIPLKDGYFRVTVPGALTASNPVALNIQWIDFYR